MTRYMCFFEGDGEHTAKPIEAEKWPEAARAFAERNYVDELGEEVCVNVRLPNGMLNQLRFDVEVEVEVHFYGGVCVNVESAYLHPRQQKDQSE